MGSLAGDVLGTAGGQYLQLSSDITAPQGDIHIAAQNLTLQSNNNTRGVLNIVRERQSGITLSASNPLVSTYAPPRANMTCDTYPERSASNEVGMTINQKSKLLRHAVKVFSDPLAQCCIPGQPQPAQEQAPATAADADRRVDQPAT